MLPLFNGVCYLRQEGSAFYYNNVEENPYHSLITVPTQFANCQAPSVNTSLIEQTHGQITKISIDNANEQRQFLAYINKNTNNK